MNSGKCPRLDERLAGVANRIRSPVHADIGTDHALLLKSLLLSGRIDKAIAVENKPGPYANACKTLEGLDADVRFADGLDGICQGEIDSLSLCGLGADRILSILSRWPSRIPDSLLLQPNNHPDRIRRWAYEVDLHLVDEQFVDGRIPYVILQFVRSSGLDPAYAKMDFCTATLLGPHLIRRMPEAYSDRLRRELDQLNSYPRLNANSRQRRDAIAKVFAQNTPQQ